MLTGRRAFDGEDVTDTLAAVLRGEPDWTALPARCRRRSPRCFAPASSATATKRPADAAAVTFVLDHASRARAGRSLGASDTGRR